MKVICGLLVAVIILLGGVLLEQHKWHEQSQQQARWEEDARVFKRQCEALDLEISKNIMSVTQCRAADLNKYYRFKDAANELKLVVNGNLLAYLKDPNSEAHIYAQWHVANDLLKEMVATWPDVTKQSAASATTADH